MDVALATCRPLPEPDPDAQPLLDALGRRGIAATEVDWGEPEHDWSSATLTVLRSTWNYIGRLPEFQAWLARAGATSILLNPEPLVRWNLHKRYLLQLADRGVPTTPTVLLPRGSAASIAELRDRHGWGELVVKPAVSAGSYRTSRCPPGAGQDTLDDLLADADTLVQPYLPSVEGHGERALIWIDGELTHAVRKNPRFAADQENVSAQAVPISAAEARLARAAIAAVAPIGQPFYARVDVAPGSGGEPVLMELELIEPSLFFAQGPAGLERFVDGLAARLAGRERGLRGGDGATSAPGVTN